MSDTRRIDPKDVPRPPEDAADDLGFDLPPPTSVSPARAIVIGVVVLAVVGGAFAAAWLPKRRAQKELAAETKSGADAVTKVQVVAPTVRTSDRSMVLPGSVQAQQETIIHPRSSGYVRKWLVDIGDKVEAGAALAEIDQPDVDQQLDQARAQLAQSKAALGQASANRDYSTDTLSRYEKLAPQGVASQQELDQYKARSKVDEANVNVAKAAIEAQEANVRRLTQQKSWGRVTAPFAGRISARTTEVGDLVSPTSSLFKLSATETVRVFVQIPQDVAPSVKSEMAAQVSVREFPGRTFDGKVARSAGALDAASRTMNTEVRVPNSKGELLSGMYAQVAITLPSPHRVYELPATAVMNDAKGLRVATVGPDNRVHLVPIVIERDTGPTIEIATGISEKDRVVKLASPTLVEGAEVSIVESAAPAK